MISGTNKDDTLTGFGHAGQDLLVDADADAGAIAFDPNDATVGSVTFLDASTLVFSSLESLVSADGREGHIWGDGPVDPIADGQKAGTQTSEQTVPDGEKVLPWLAVGTRVQTDCGEMPVERIRAGDRVLTRDRGYRRVIWAGRREFAGADMQTQPQLVPVRIEKGALGPGMPVRDMQVSPQQRLLAQGPHTKLLFGTTEVLIPALHLVGYPGITRGTTAGAACVQILCDQHEVILSDGIWSESLPPDDLTSAGMDAAQHHEIEAILADRGPQTAGVGAARRTLRRHEADLLLA